MHVTGAFINVETLGDTPREKKEGEVVARVCVLARHVERFAGQP